MTFPIKYLNQSSPLSIILVVMYHLIGVLHVLGGVTCMVRCLFLCISTNKRGAQPISMTNVNSSCNSVKCQVAAPFLWEVPPPFVMSPSEGVVEVGESKAVTCSIRPSAASVFVSQALLRVGQGVNAIKPKPLLDMKARIEHKYRQTGTGVERMGVCSRACDTRQSSHL